MIRVEGLLDCVENLPKALVGVHSLSWIATYPVDKVIHSLNNWGLICSYLLFEQLEGVCWDLSSVSGKQFFLILIIKWKKHQT